MNLQSFILRRFLTGFGLGSHGVSYVSLQPRVKKSRADSVWHFFSVRQEWGWDMISYEMNYETAAYAFKVDGVLGRYSWNTLKSL